MMTSTAGMASPSGFFDKKGDQERCPRSPAIEKKRVPHASAHRYAPLVQHADTVALRVGDTPPFFPLPPSLPALAGQAEGQASPPSADHSGAAGTETTMDNIRTGEISGVALSIARHKKALERHLTDASGTTLTAELGARRDLINFSTQSVEDDVLKRLYLAALVIQPRLTWDDETNAMLRNLVF
ncbi:hypothetical protein NAC44_20920 [Allorhizobium sp. BGMRC 0089]|uniref:hypothetical protein n=1 Tax=Allorhizobium sonneratiae TaxID=2934936 RepID=UPI0020344ED9|nr:hypothetical protein [Allorhizobium sonneratiae]MCM2294793.1 hypothetical protein [Allorhizobium sonneratiae]